MGQLYDAVNNNATGTRLQQLFKTGRLSYKHIEFLITYLHPDISPHMNGPAVPEVEEEDNQNTVIDPEGFQVMESLLFPVYDTKNKEALLSEIQQLRATCRRLKFLQKNISLTDSAVFKALRREVFRVATLGIAGYDADLSHYSIAETEAVWQTIRYILEQYATQLQEVDAALANNNKVLLENGIRYLQQHPDFDSFNRMQFLLAYANPVSRALWQTATALHIDISNGREAIRTTAATLFDKDAFDINFYVADASEYVSPEKENLGRVLFYDPMLSGNGTRSCASCHQPGRAFSDTVAKNATFDGRNVIKRNTLTLMNAGLQPALFYDTRVTYLEDQVVDVLTNENEMHGSVSKAITFLKSNPRYVALFKKAFPHSQGPVTPYHLQNAIGTYIRSLTSLDAPFDRYMRGDSTQLTAREINGFNLYMGKAKCGTCHFAPLFNGVLPPEFNRMESEVLGVPVAPEVKRIDADKGRYLLHPAAPNLYSFRVPTLRNIALTAPYMHNGAFTTLNQVMEFYNNGGGAGMGIQLPNQTLPAVKLNLTAAEQEDIIAFLQKLTDTATIHAAPENMQP